MIAFKDCEYSLFVSYAHDDDSAEDGWVQSLRTAISKRLDRLHDDIPKLGLHLSRENGPVAGSLGAELRERVEKSFGMLLVVGQKYVNSQWCEKELKFFRDHFGDDGFRSRLYIAVMAEADVEKAQQGEQWKQLMPADQLWVPMFDETESNQPLPHRMADGSAGFPPAFFMQASKIADRLIKEIERDYAASKQQLTPSTAARPTGAAVAPPDKAGQRRIVIGPHTASLAARVQGIKAALEAAGAEVSVLDRHVIDDYDPDDDGRPLRPTLADADVLVVPMTLERPLQPSTPGGHTTLLAREWAAAGKAERSLVWFRPSDVVVDAAEMAPEKHQKCFEQLAPVCFSETALVNHLFGIGSGSAIRLHIENHPQARAFRRLARQLEEAWRNLPPDPARPALSCVALDLDDLANASKDVAGVMLLLPVPIKDPKSLLNQISTVQEFIPKEGTYPGCVAILYDPPLGKVPKHEWSYVQIRRSDVEPKLTIEDDSKLELEEFLFDLWERYRLKTAAAPAAGSAVGPAARRTQ